MSRDKFEVLREGLAEFQRTGRSWDDFADDFVWDFSGLEGWIEDNEYHGRQGFDEQLARWTEPFETWSWEITQLIDAGDDDILGIGVQRGLLKGSTQPVEMPLAQIFTIRDEKLHRIRLFAQPKDAYEAAGLPVPGQASA